MIKKLFLTNIITLLIVGFCTNIAEAIIVDSQQIKDAVYEKVESDLQKSDLDKFELSVGDLPFDQLSFPEGNLEIKPEGLLTKNYTSRMITRVSFYVNGKYIKAVGIPVSIKAYKKVYVASTPIEKEELITIDKVKLKLTDISNNTKKFPSEKDFVRGVKALKPFNEDEVISGRFTRATPDVQKNSIVKVIVNSKNTIFVTTEAIALADGRVGDMINVQNKKLNKVYTGKIIGENKVLIKI